MKTTKLSLTVRLYSPEEFSKKVTSQKMPIRTWVSYNTLPETIDTEEVIKTMLNHSRRFFYTDKMGRITYKASEDKDNHLSPEEFISGNEFLPKNRTYIVY